MRKSYIFPIIIILSSLAACKSEKSKITEAAYGYLNATANYQVEEAMPYATKETREVTLPFMRDRLLPITDKKYIESNTPATIEINEIRIENDTAVVNYTKTTPIQNTHSTIQLIKVEGIWLVDVKLDIPEKFNPLFKAWDEADSTKATNNFQGNAMQ